MEIVIWNYTVQRLTQHYLQLADNAISYYKYNYDS